MNWIEQEHASRRHLQVTEERALELDKTKQESYPVIAGEVGRGIKPLKEVRFQPVQSPGIFEAEFAQRDSTTDDGKISRDVIFHFWPWGLHAADKREEIRPSFRRGFKEALQKVMTSEYQGLVQIEDDRDMGAFFVRIRGAGGQQFWHQLAVKAVTTLHLSLGGE